MAAVFSGSIPLDLPYQKDWNIIQTKRQKLLDNTNKREDKRHTDDYFVFENKVMIINEDQYCKARCIHSRSFTVIQVHLNKFILIPFCHITECIISVNIYY